MDCEMNKSSNIKKIFRMKTIAVVGMSPNPNRPSHYVALYLRDQGYKIVPVNPNCIEIAGEICFPSIKQIPFQVDIVEVFRRSEYIYPIAEDAIEISAKVLWLQDTVINEKAANLAKKAGLLVVMNDCMMRRHYQLIKLSVLKGMN